MVVKKNGGSKMKKGINIINIIILVFMIAIGGTACMKSPEETESSSIPTSSVQSSEASSPTEGTEFTVTSDKQIVEAFLAEYFEYRRKDSAKYADEVMSQAEKLTDRYLGSVTSEEDAKEKAEAVWMEINKGFFEDIKETFKSGKQPYIEATFYEKYDFWYLNTPISGITEDGVSFGITGGCQIIIRKSDGKVLAVW